jgi:adenosylcobinamide-GDP ribazoletransferase
MQGLEAGLRAAAGAIAFLTRVPVGRWVALDGEDVARGAVLFPVVGAGLGALVGLVVVGLDATLTALVAAALAVALEALVTGGIHLDAVADSADGLGAATRQRALEIMREPTIGAFGATALLLDLLVKTAALAAVVSGPRALLAVAAAYALGRTAPLALGWALPYARAEAAAAPRSRAARARSPGPSASASGSGSRSRRSACADSPSPARPCSPPPRPA